LNITTLNKRGLGGGAYFFFSQGSGHTGDVGNFVIGGGGGGFWV